MQQVSEVKGELPPRTFSSESESVTSSCDASRSNGDIIAELATFVTARRLEVAAIFFLELSKPLAGVIHAGMTGIQPVWVLLWGPKAIKQMMWLCEDRQRIEDLIQTIEEAARGR